MEHEEQCGDVADWASCAAMDPSRRPGADWRMGGANWDAFSQWLPHLGGMRWPACCEVDQIAGAYSSLVEKVPGDGANGNQPEMFEVAFDVGPSGRLGLELQYVQERLVIPVGAVLACGAVAEWNRIQPAFEVREGDLIVAVNGVSGGAERVREVLVAAVRSNAPISMILARVPSEHRESSEDADFVNRHGAGDIRRPSAIKDPFFAEMSDAGRATLLLSPRARKLGAAAEGLHGPWQAAWSQTRGKVYYHNPVTQNNVWMRPESSLISAEEHGQMVGKWEYPGGVYVVSAIPRASAGEDVLHGESDFELLFEDAAAGISGVLEPEGGGRYLCAISDVASGTPIGTVSLTREKNCIVSNFKAADSYAKWGPDAIATRVA